jgi:PhzF family phenazine biosynthesis protein
MADKVTVNIINAFTDSGTGGNPAGVVYPADSLTNQIKQKVATQVGKSETAFVSKSETADFKLDFFTPTKQIAHCGHATIATFSYLSQQGIVKGARSSKETIDGNRDIFLKGEVAYMQQLAPKYFPFPFNSVTRQNILDSLNITMADLLDDYEPMVVNTGNSFLIVPIKDQPILKSLLPDFKAIGDISEKLNLIGYYPFTLETQNKERDAAARMFAPYYGIKEESATGMAAGPLGCYLHGHLNIKKPDLIIEQGRLMTIPSPSELLVDLSLKDGRIKSLIVGGRAKVMSVLEVEI